MPRRYALLQLRKTLLARRAELSTRLAGESANLHAFEAADGTGDIVDAAFERESDEMSAQLLSARTQPDRTRFGAFAAARLWHLRELPETDSARSAERSAGRHTLHPV